MIIKNIVIRHENHRLIIESKDCDMIPNKIEEKASCLVDTILNEILENNDTLDLIMKVKIK